MLRKSLAVLFLLLVPALALAQRTVTRVAIVANPKVYTGPCPADIKFTATIFVSHQPTFADYVWERSDGAKGPRQHVDIRSAGRGVSETWHIGAGHQHYVIWERLHVLAPTGIYSPQARVTVNCR